MSASPVARQATQSQSIPSRRVLINDPSQLPVDYSSTPGGTLYSTTPGGTRIVYERATLLHLRNSPLSRTPPNIPDLPDILNKGEVKKGRSQNGIVNNNRKAPVIEESHEQFEIDI